LQQFFLHNTNLIEGDAFSKWGAIIKHKIKLAFALFVVLTAYFSGASLPAYANIEPYCHEQQPGSGEYILLHTNESGQINGHDGNGHENDLLGQECLEALCPAGQIFSEAENICVALPTISINDVTQVEGDSDNFFTFTITRTGSTDTAISVKFDTSDGPGPNPATAGNDYVSIVIGTANIANGATSTTVDITVKGDTDIEPNETFTVTLSDPTGATIDDGQGLGTIENDDVEPPLVCDEGFHDEEGICVPDVEPPLVCDEGFHDEEGICVPDVEPPLMKDSMMKKGFVCQM